MKNNLKVGQIVYVKENRIPGLQESTITKVGNKYFYLDKYVNYKFSIEKLWDVLGYSPSKFVYLDKQEYYDEIEINKLHSKIRDCFSSNKKLNLNKLRAIDGIINMDDNDKISLNPLYPCE